MGRSHRKSPPFSNHFLSLSCEDSYQDGWVSDRRSSRRRRRHASSETHFHRSGLGAYFRFSGRRWQQHRQHGRTQSPHHYRRRWLPSPPSRRCGSPSRSSTRLDLALFTASASKCIIIIVIIAHYLKNYTRIISSTVYLYMENISK